LNQQDVISKMIKSADVAANVSQVLQGTFNALGESMLQVNASCGEAEAALYREKIGDIFYILVFGLLEPLYEEHPRLKPADWDDRKT
jgi:hypothetical protein